MHRFSKLFLSASVLGVLVGVLVLTTPLVCHSKPLGVNVMNQPTVTVGNSSASPIPVFNVDNPVSQPVAADIELPLNAGEVFKRFTLFTVPAGKRLVIEYASYWASVGAGDLPFIQIMAAVGGPTIFYAVPVSKVGAQGGGDFFSGAQNLRVYANPGTDVTIQFDRNLSATPATGRMAFSGYLVDVP